MCEECCGDTPSYPTVTLNCGSSSTTPAGVPRTISAIISQAATVTFSLNGVQDSSQTITATANQTVQFVVRSSILKTNTVTITANNSNGSGSASCSWTVIAGTSINVTMACPDPSYSSQPPRVTVTTDQTATIEIYVDNSLTPISITTNGTSSTCTLPSGLSAGTHTITAKAWNSTGSGQATCSWTVWAGSQPALSITCPDSSSTTIAGQSQSFPVTLTQADATITVFINGVQDNSQTTSVTAGQTITVTGTSSVVGTNTIQVVASDGHKPVSVTCNWTVVQCDPALNSSYIDFNIHQYRCCSGDWKEAICYHNAIILMAWAGCLSQWQDQLANCYWRKIENCTEHPFNNSTAPSKNLYFVSITNTNCNFPGHAVVGELVGSDITNFNDWKFIQWGNMNIIPGNIETTDDGEQIVQMPFGCITTDQNGNQYEYLTKIEIQRITGISVTNCSITKTYDVLITFYIDSKGVITRG